MLAETDIIMMTHKASDASNQLALLCGSFTLLVVIVLGTLLQALCSAPTNMKLLYSGTPSHLPWLAIIRMP